MRHRLCSYVQIHYHITAVRLHDMRHILTLLPVCLQVDFLTFQKAATALSSTLLQYKNVRVQSYWQQRWHLRLRCVRAGAGKSARYFSLLFDSLFSLLTSITVLLLCISTLIHSEIIDFHFSHIYSHYSDAHKAGWPRSSGSSTPSSHPWFCWLSPCRASSF